MQGDESRNSTAAEILTIYTDKFCQFTALFQSVALLFYET